MSELSDFGPTSRDATPTVRVVVRIAAGQGGVIEVGQLRATGVSSSTAARWRATGWLTWLYPGVYAVGHTAIGLFGRLNAALLYAGEDAALSHQTAGFWWEFLDSEPTTIHLSRPRKRLDRPGIRIHFPREVRAVSTRSFG